MRIVVCIYISCWLAALFGTVFAIVVCRFSLFYTAALLNHPSILYIVVCTTKSHAGVMTMGGTNKQLHQNQMTYAAIMPDSPWFTIYVQAMYLELPPVVRTINGTKTKKTKKRRVEKLQNLNATRLNKGEIIFDSGTTDIFLPKLMSIPFQNAWEKLMGSSYYEKQALIKDGVVLPNILIQMRGAVKVQGEEERSRKGGGRLARGLDKANPNDAIFVIPPKHYIPKGGKSPMRMTEKEGDGAVLGAYAMMGYDILFDVENNRVGFADSDCHLESLL